MRVRQLLLIEMHGIEFTTFSIHINSRAGRGRSEMVLRTDGYLIVFMCFFPSFYGVTNLGLRVAFCIAFVHIDQPIFVLKRPLDVVACKYPLAPLMIRLQSNVFFGRRDSKRISPVLFTTQSCVQNKRLYTLTFSRINQR